VRILENKWSGPRINFKFLDCPACNRRIKSTHKGINKLVREALDLEKAIIEMAEK
jgi:hypothetical protein